MPERVTADVLDHSGFAKRIVLSSMSLFALF